MILSRRGFVRGLVASILASLTVPFMLRVAYMLPRRRYTRAGVGMKGKHVLLPMPKLKGTVTVEEAIANRRSIRDYTDDPIELWELGQVLWAAYGISETRNEFHTSPSAGATYPLEVYVVVHPRGVKLPQDSFLEPGSYHYDPRTHSLRLVKPGDLSVELYRAAVEQEWVLNAKANLVFTAVFERTMARYGQRGERYVWIEVGHAGQNVYLQAQSLGLATVAIGAFYDEWVREIIGAPPNHRPAYIMPLARPAWRYRLAREDLEAYIQRHRGT